MLRYKRALWVILVIFIVAVISYNLYNYNLRCDTPTESFERTKEKKTYELIEIVETNDIALVEYKIDNYTLGSAVFFKDTRGWSTMYSQLKGKIYQVDDITFQLKKVNEKSVCQILLRGDINVSSISDSVGSEFYGIEYTFDDGSPKTISGIFVLEGEIPDDYFIIIGDKQLNIAAIINK